MQGIVKFNNLHSCKNLMIDDVIWTKKCTHLVINNGRKSLKTTQNYYYQVQTAMLCTNTQWCDFFLWTTVDNIVSELLLMKGCAVIFFQSLESSVSVLFYPNLQWEPYQTLTAKPEASFGTISPIVDLYGWQKALWKSRPVNISQCLKALNMNSYLV